ncbi:MAG TPA: helix-turn-helix domain-containing protein [Vicinamibacterales bacterium]|nr:helix-turn-helix domain-containing protein [Vicinamibacterales bacterium]
MIANLIEVPKRRSQLPEFTEYKDTGCDVSPSCFTCPLVKCRYDTDAGGKRSLQRRARLSQVAALRRRGLTVDQIAQMLGLSRRTIFRDMKGVTN